MDNIVQFQSKQELAIKRYANQLKHMSYSPKEQISRLMDCQIEYEMKGMAKREIGQYLGNADNVRWLA